MNTLKRIGVGLMVCSPLALLAQAGSPPLDLSTTGSTVAGYIAAAAGAGVAVLGALYGIRVIIRAFKAVK